MHAQRLLLLTSYAILSLPTTDALLHASRSTSAQAAGARDASLAPDVATWAEDYRAPLVKGQGVSAAGASLSIGHLEIQLAAGLLHPVIVGGHLAGIFFAGEGTYRYTSDEAFEAPFLKRTVSAGSGYQVEADGAVVDRIESALLLFAGGEAGAVAAGDRSGSRGDVLLPDGGPAAPPTQGSGGTRAALLNRADLLPPGAEGSVFPALSTADRETLPPAASLKQFREHLERWRGYWGNGGYPQLLAQARIDPPVAPLAWVELDGAKHQALFVRDTLRAGEESLEVLRGRRTGVDFLDARRYGERLSTQPLERSRLEPRALRFVLTDLDVTLVNPREREAVVTVVETFEAQVPLRSLDLHLPNLVVGTIGLFPRVRGLEYRLLGVTDEQDRKLAFTHRNDNLVVELAGPLAPGDHTTLRFELEGDVLFRPHNDSYWHLGGPWYPTPARWAMESFRYHAVVKAADGFQPFSNGRTVRRWTEGKLTCAEFREEALMQGASILAGKYSTFTDERKGRVVRVSSYAISKDDAKRRLAALAHTLIEFYEPLLGPYPFHELNVIEINAKGFGQAPAGIIFITKEAFTPLAELRARRFQRGVNAHFAHEVAHAWWGHVAKLSDVDDQWLSESFADYSAAVAVGAVTRGEFSDSLNRWRNGARRVEGKWSLYLANAVPGDEAHRERRDLLYNKGPLVLQALREEIGDETFFALLRTTLRSFAMKPMWTRDFLATTNQVTGRDFRPWFDRYVFGSETPVARYK